MWFQKFFESLTSTPTHRRPTRRRSPASRLRLEALEDRTVPAFLAPVGYTVGGIPGPVGPVVTGDFNGDGRLDLAVADMAYVNVSVLLNNGDGTFQAARNVTTSSTPTSLAVGDFNGDGKLDLVTGNSQYELNLFAGKGDGTFQPATTFHLPGEFPPGYTGTTPLPQKPLSVAVGDLNRDGKLDLVVTGVTIFQSGSYPGAYGWYPIYQENGYVNVLLGHGDSNFSTASSTLLGSASPFFVALGDFNGDLAPDVVITNFDSPTVSVLLGNGDGTLHAPASFATGASGDPYPTPRSVAVGDFNGDGKLDLVTANGGNNTASVLLGSGNGTFGTAANFAVGPVGDGNISVAVGDFNRDGKTDFAVTNSGNFPGGVSVLLGNGNGTFRTALNYAAGSASDPRVGSVAVGDFNADGSPDLAVGNAFYNVSVLLNANDWLVPQASTLVLSGFPASTTAGVAGSFTVTAKTTTGTTAANYTGTVHFSSTDGQAGLPADYTFTVADAGVHTFRATLKTAGTQSISATDTVTAGLTGTDGGITVKPAAASRFILTVPSSVKAGVAFSLTLSVQDAFGNVVVGYTGTIHFKSTDKTATLPTDFRFTAANQGVHSFNGLVLRKKGYQRLTHTDTLNSLLTGNANENVW